jgi:LuxR family maltose regulon positive regulatory protein
MPETLLRTKLIIPPLRPNFVPRPRLLEQLSAGMKGTLTLISAPVGYGKTTLFGEWQAGPGAEVPVAWLSLDAGDDDPARFWPYFLMALNTIQEGLADDALSLFTSIQVPPVERLLTILINELSNYPQDFVLVLDDLHTIRSSEVHKMLAFLLDHLPKQMHLVILTRADPPLPLARLRVSGRLVEIRQRDLRFTQEEATAFLRDLMGLSLTVSDVQALLGRTEGWIAGLQLAALSIQGRPDPSQIIADFGGAYHYIVDYLVQEVLQRQPDLLRKFLLQTSILDSLNGSLCEALTGDSGGEETLERLMRDNLFVTRLGGECCWYRYHSLFADVTRSLLRRTLPEQIPELHRRAANWYARNDLIVKAIDHALAAEDWHHAASLLAEYSQVAWRSGRITRILEWVEALPEELLPAYPRLGVNYGWACILTGRHEVCEAVCAMIEASVRSDPELYVGWLTVQSFLARARGQQERAVELAQLARRLPEAGSVDTRTLLMLSLSIALWDLGRVRESAAAADEASRLAETATNWHAWAVMQAFLGLARAAQGNLHLARDIYERVTRTPDGMPEWIGAGFAQVCLSALHYEWNDLDTADAYARTALNYSQITGHSEIELNCYRQLAFIAQARGDPQEAWRVLDEAEEVIRQHRLPRLWGPEHVLIALAQNDLNRAQQWFAEVHGEYGAAIHYPAIPLEGARLALARGERPAAAEMLANSFEKASREEVRYAQIEIRILQALAADDEAQAMACFSEALAWAEPEGFCRIFVDQGEMLAPLLRAAAQKGVHPAYAAQLLAALEGSAPGDGPAAQPLIDPLTPRELEVLQLVVAGMSNQQIADELVIALGTVKRHVYNIFDKLNVRSRAQCAARARELHLLQ